MKKEIVIFGAGGHSKVIIDIFEKQDMYYIKYIVEKDPKTSFLLDYPIISEEDFFQNQSCIYGFVGIGDNFIRSKVAKNILSRIPDFHFVSAVHPTAQIARDVKIGPGTCLMAHTTINSSVEIGQHVIINTNASVDHDCKLMNFTSVAPNAAIGGSCFVDELSAISIGTTVIHNIHIGKNTVVGAGATVVNDLDSDSLYLGTPAKKKKNRTMGQKYL